MCAAAPHLLDRFGWNIPPLLRNRYWLRMRFELGLRANARLRFSLGWPVSPVQLSQRCDRPVSCEPAAPCGASGTAFYNRAFAVFASWPEWNRRSTPFACKAPFYEGSGSGTNGYCGQAPLAQGSRSEISAGNGGVGSEPGRACFLPALRV